ncbi:phosphonate C-P lyase system protein PhnG [Oceanospirillum maris]|uniref:phosphonate C-P lyase system protein PhnG n=1 Tax=Oceanospirillum maris TaxID=64977 RepID=UPI0004009F2D|nr:phosphonate C-P lyase system protein PhnG [Oceanospirillum maris]
MSVESQQERPAATARQQWMAVLAKSDSDRLQQYWQGLALSPDYQFIRKPEIGLTMLRGRIGGGGQPFNMGEMTLTRCAVRLASGTLGISYVAGRHPQHAITAALADALLQEDTRQNLLQKQLIEPLQAELEAGRQQRAAQANSTRVDFFTLVRGED